MSEIEPDSEYQNKHSRSIALDTYNGIANDLMILNTPLADRFMQVSDMRSDIAIIQQLQDRVRDYEDVGFVKVAKFLKMPRFDVWRNEDTITQVRRENDTWLIAVNDQDLANKISRTDDGKKFNERFTDAFNTEVNQGLMTCLKREKFLNSGKYDTAFMCGITNLGHNIASVSLMLAAAAVTRSPEATAHIAVYSLINMAFVNLICNSLNWEHTEKSPLERIFRSKYPDFESNIPFLKNSVYNDPFIKHSLPEFLLPGVPVDRYLRGRAYLKNHGKDLITI